MGVTSASARFSAVGLLIPARLIRLRHERSLLAKRHQASRTSHPLSRQHHRSKANWPSHITNATCGHTISCRRKREALIWLAFRLRVRRTTSHLQAVQAYVLPDSYRRGLCVVLNVFMLGCMG
jgi:hypothetical protein